MKRFISGRSMIEMIATLAIIGVLSAVGVWGLNNALTKHKVNTLIEDVRLSGFIVADELFKSLPDDEEGMNLAGKFEKQTSYEFRAFAEKETTFEILVKNVPYSVCEEVKKRKVEWLEEIKANGIPNTCNEGTSNNISFFFNTELMGNTEQQTEECRANKDCPSDKPYCRNGYCTKCETGLQLSGGSCVNCPTQGGSISNTTAEQCRFCGEGYYFETSYNSCSGCENWHNDFTTTKEECDRCPNRCWDDNDKRCYMSEIGNVFINSDGTCNYTCPTGQLAVINKGSYGMSKCVNCPTQADSINNTTLEQCHICGQNYYFATSYNSCNGCENWRNYFATTKEECDRCPNRCWDDNDKRCYMSEIGNVFINSDGTCNYTCPTGQLAVINKGNAGVSKCVNCPTQAGSISNTTAEQCRFCGEGYYFTTSYNNCDGCEYWRNDFTTTKEECDRCPNRCWDDNDKRCYMSEIGNVFINSDGTCNYTCPTGQLAVINKGSGVSKCVNCPTQAGSISNTTLEQCRFCGEGYYFATSYNSCNGCKYWRNDFTTTKDECDRCPNRYFDETSQLCQLCPTGKKASADGLSCVDQ